MGFYIPRHVMLWLSQNASRRLSCTSSVRILFWGNVAGLTVPERMNSDILKASRRSVYRLEAYATSGDA